MKQSISSRLRNRIRYQKVIVTHDYYGGPLETYEDLFSCWAEVKTIGGDEAFKANLVDVSTVQYRITIRYRTDIDHTGRIILEDGTALDVRYVRDPNGRREILEIGAIIKSAGGANVYGQGTPYPY